MKDPVVIVGAGALGSHLALLLRNVEAPLKVVDFDRVEQKNTLAQMHTRMSLGRNKAQSMQQALQGMFGLRIEAIPHKLNPDNADQLLSGATLVVDCTDNIAARTLIQARVRALDIPTVHACLSAAGDFARVVWTEHFTADAEGAEGEATCEDGEQLPFFGLAAAQAAVVVQTFLRDGRKVSCQISPTGFVRLA